MMNIQLTQYAWFKPRRVIGITLSVAILLVPSPLLAQGVCIQQIMYGKDPQTGEWKQFSTSCEVPAGWETSPTEPASTGGVDGKDTTETTADGNTPTNSPTGTTDNTSSSETATETPATSGTDTTPPTTGTTETGTTNTPPPTNPTTDGPADCPAQITYAKPSETSQKWYLFSTSCDVPDGWIKADNEVCAEVVVYAQNPTSKNWFTFVTPCDAPEGWGDPVFIKPSNEAYKDCSMTPQTGYAQSPKTANWYEFANLCDAPQNWNPTGVKPENVELFNPQVVDCPPTLTYAQPPNSKHWYAFATPCDVPATWEKVGVVQQEEASTGESCEAFYASYSFTEGKLEIPRIWVNGLSEKPSLYEKIQMQHVGDIDSPNFSYFLFSFDIKMSLQPITPSQ